MPITRASRANHANRTLLLNKIKFAFGSIVSEFLFLICVQKASSMKILLFCVINSSRHIESTLYGVLFTRCLCQKPSLARTSLGRVFDTNNSWIKPRTPHFLCRKLYIWHSGHARLEFAGFENRKYTADDRFHGKGPYGEILTKK